MRIQHNIMAMNAYRNYNNNTSALSKNLEKLSSGYKINRAGDDAAGLAISEKMRAQITALGTAQKNVKDGISLVKTAEGATQEIHDMLNRMVDLATQSANGTYQDEVDREAIQDEYNALKTEINRIADASNFNGIKLLDGSLGLNGEAFKMSSAAAVEASDGPLSAAFVAAEADGSPKYHPEGESATAATPTAKIDLGDLKVNVAAGGTGTVTFNIGGTNYTASLSNAAGATAKEFTTSEIADALVTQLNTGIASASGNTTTGQDSMKIGDAAFTAANNGGVITLTYKGTKTDGTTYKAETTFSGNQAAADAINGNLGFDVTATVAGGTKTGDVIHKAVDVERAAAEVAATKAGIDIKMDAGMVVNGGTLEIDGKKFYFQTDAANDPAITGATKIDVSSAKTDAERQHLAADLLSQEAEFAGQDGRKWKIGVNGDGKTIHIDQTAASTAGKELKTYEDVAGVVKANGVATAAKGAGTKIAVTNANVKEGDGLTINGKLYVFADKASTTIPKDAVKVAIKGGAGKNLADAISGSEYDATTNTVTVRGAVGGTAPTVLGRGLNLQIGEDSQAYNQLSVGITDMHTETLGLDAVNLDTQTNAQAAVDVIKNAINSVSATRGKLGATQNRLEHTANNLSTMKENIQDAESTIRDTDIAEEMMAYTKNNILVQSAQAMLAQANQIPQGVLQLLG